MYTLGFGCTGSMDVVIGERCAPVSDVHFPMSAGLRYTVSVSDAQLPMRASSVQFLLRPGFQCTPVVFGTQILIQELIADFAVVHLLHLQPCCIVKFCKRTALHCAQGAVRTSCDRSPPAAISDSSRVISAANKRRAVFEPPSGPSERTLQESPASAPTVRSHKPR